MVENAKIQKLKCDILSNFQTMCYCGKYHSVLKSSKKSHCIAYLNSIIFGAKIQISCQNDQNINLKKWDFFLAF